MDAGAGDAVDRLIRGHAGVHALYKRDKLYYVGLANNMMSRVNHHLKDRHKGKVDRFSVYLATDNAHMRPLEALMLRVINPFGNKVKGKLTGAQDMVRLLKRKMDEYQRNETASLLGGRFVSHRRRSNPWGCGNFGAGPARRAPDPAEGLYKGEEYRATLRRDRHIHAKRKLFDSPYAAAKVATGRSRRGWYFWHCRNARGEWVRLENMKR